MAEILGTVVGVVSLGIQLCSGINTYLEGVQCRKEDIESTVRKVEFLKSIIDQIQGDEGRLAPTNTNDAVLKAMSNARVELLLLDEFIGKVYANDSSTTPETFRGKIKGQTQKFLYPFRRDHLDRLNGRLDAANDALQAALQTLQISFTSDNNKVLKRLAMGVDSMRLEVQEGIVLLSAVQQESIALRDDIAALKASALSSPSPMAAIQTLTSKSSGLKMICDIVGAHHLPEQPVDVPESSSSEYGNFYSKFKCRCSFRRIARRRKRQFGPAFLLEETVHENEHEIGCFFATPGSTANNKWSAGISVKAFRFLVSTAVTVTMSSTFGAGGYSIAPSFTYFHVHAKSPAFEVIRILKDAFCSSNWSDEESENLLERGIRTIRTSFEKRMSSPFDVDFSDETLLHSASFASDNHWYRPRNLLLKYLLDAKVPKDRPDARGRLPFQDALGTSSWGGCESHGTQAVDMLVPDESIMALEIREIDRIYAGHPTEAIFLRKGKDLFEALKKTTSVLDLSAVDAGGHTALHHLVGWHEGLKMVLQNFGKSILQLYDNSETPALQVALYWSGHLCTSPISIRCSETCSCAATVKLLLDVDRDCLLRAVSRGFFLSSMGEASAKARDLVLDELTHRRQALKDFASLELKPALVDRFGLRLPGVLDLHIHNVLDELQKAGKAVPRELQTELYDEKPSTSVYHRLGNLNRNVRHLSDAFYSRGFQDIDIPSSDGSTPLIQSYYSQHSVWLIEHGARLDARVPGEVDGYTAAHYLFTRTDKHAWGTEDMKPTLLDVLRSRVGEDWNLDNCVCACSSNGCHPYTTMWKEYLFWELRGDMTKKRLNKMTKRVYKKCTELEEGWNVTRPVKSVALRACTFAVLPLRHTCCSHWKPWEGAYWFSREPLRVYTQDEIEDIHEEDAAEIARLESLLVEFEEKLDQMDCSLAEFFQTYWKSRMEEVLVEIENQSITAEEIESARQLGVVLQVQPAEVVTEEIEDRSNVQYWIQKMDALVK
nr:uncharacterized protein CTRU02_05975 [Colletotrichum truncatum]KAF6793103.1 hypothetical protein CTRU02_05975 [Colletotrichum truncatum]